MSQTAIIIRHGSDEILVRIEGVLISHNKIKVDSRPFPTAAWQPKPDHTVEVRLENG